MINKEENISIYEGNEIRNIGTPLIVTAISFPKYEVDQFVGEYYIFLRNRERKFLKKIISYQFSEEFIETKEISNDFLKDEVLSRAKARLSDHLSELYEKTKNIFYLETQFVLKAADERKLLRLWMSGKNKNEIISIMNDTGCAKLRKLLNKYQSVPYITVENEI